MVIPPKSHFAGLTTTSFSAVMAPGFLTHNWGLLQGALGPLLGLLALCSQRSYHLWAFKKYPRSAAFYLASATFYFFIGALMQLNIFPRVLTMTFGIFLIFVAMAACSAIYWRTYDHMPEH